MTQQATAEAAPDNALEQEVTPPQEPTSDVVAEPESVTPEAEPEAVGDAAPEKAPEPEPFDIDAWKETDEGREYKETITKDVTARTTQSVERSAAATAKREARNSQVTEAQELLSGQASKALKQYLYRAAREDDSEQLEGDRFQRWSDAQNAVDPLITAVTNAAVLQSGELLNENWRTELAKLNPDHKIGDELEGKLQEAKGNSIQEGKLSRQAVFEAGKAAGFTEGRTKATAEAKDTTETAQRAAQEERAKAKAEGTPSPTGQGSGTATERKPVDIIEDHAGTTWQAKKDAYLALTGEEFRP